MNADTIHQAVKQLRLQVQTENREIERARLRLRFWESFASALGYGLGALVVLPVLWLFAYYAGWVR